MATQPTNPWQYATDAQKLALDCEADIVFFGGSAGSLKSHTLLLDAMQEYEHPRLRALICRESYPNLADLIDKSFRLYQPKGGLYNEQKKTWTFKSGAQIKFGYMSADRDVYQYWGAEYSFIGFDESTFHTEFQVRTILSRLRSTHPKLKLRMRLASNPGNMGASWHQKIFLRGACPVHEPTKCAVPGKLYRDAVWPSDDKPIPFSVAFIPGKLSDHSLLQADYADNLKSMSGNLADQLLDGCWCKLSGSFYGPIWNKQRMVVPFGSIGEQYWWQFWISLDYGFGKSWAAAGLYVKTPPSHGFPEGRMFKLAEICVPHTPAYQFAEAVTKAFIEPLVSGEHRRNISVVYLDPANFKDIGDGHTIADQINEIFAAYGIGCTPASNDRIGGWQLLYRTLDAGEFAIADTCPMTAESIRTRVHDEKKPGDILKISGDPLDDVGDETRYAIYSFINQPEKPKEIRMAEAMKPHLDAGDLTNAHLAAERMRHQMESEDFSEHAGANIRQRMAMMSRRRGF